MLKIFFYSYVTVTLICLFISFLLAAFGTEHSPFGPSWKSSFLHKLYDIVAIVMVFSPLVIISVMFLYTIL